MEPQYLPETLEGERVILRRYTMDQAEEHYRAINDNKEFLTRFMRWASWHSELNDTKKFIAQQILAWENKECFDYIIWEKETGKLVGGIGTVGIKWHHKDCGIGYWLIEEAQGRGYMSESLKLIENELFKAGFNRVAIRMRTANEKSKSVPERNSYNHEGTLRNHIIENDEVRSSHIYSKIREEWEAEK